MSCLSFPVEELSRLRVSIRILASGGFALSVQPSANANSQVSDSAGGGCTSSYSVKFETQKDGDEHILQVFTTLDRGSPRMQSPVVETAQFTHSLDSDETIVNDMESLEFSELDMNLSEFDFNALTQQGLSYDGPSGIQAASQYQWSFPDLPDRTKLDSQQCAGVLGASVENRTYPMSTASGSPAVKSVNALPDESDAFSPCPSSSSSAPPPASPDSDGANSPTSYSPSRRKRTVACPKCPRHFTNEYTLKVHSRTHKPKTPKSLPCTMGCHEHFSRQHDRLRHEVLKHARECEWVCERCRKFFSSKRTLSNHMCRDGGSAMRWEIS